MLTAFASVFLPEKKYVEGIVRFVVLSRKFRILAPKNGPLFEANGILVEKTQKIDFFRSD